MPSETNTRILARRHHPYGAFEAEPGETKRSDAADGDIVKRIMASYRRSVGRDYHDAQSFWRTISDERHRALHQLLAHGCESEIAEALRNPKSNDLLYGFEMLFKELHERMSKDPAAQRKWAGRVKDHLVRLGEALGVVRIENPEGGPWLQSIHLDLNAVLDTIEARLGVRLAPPWFWDGFFGLQTQNGVIGDRIVHAAYCAHRIRQLLRGVERPSVLEIGAGVGHLARIAYSMDFCDYAIVDIPLTNVAQGYFLARTIGEDAVVLDGEQPKRRAIRLMTPDHLEENHYDLVVNVDSFTEMGRATACAYLEKIFRVTGCLLSINHEANAFTVNELMREAFPGLAIERFPCWLRNGYVEEIVRRR